MAARYPCPNPVCTHEFDPAQVAGATSVTCPVCGIVIQLRAATPVAAPPVPPAQPPDATVPLARPVHVPMAVPVARRPAAAAATTTASSSTATSVPLMQPVATSPPPMEPSTTQPPANAETPIIRTRKKQRDRLTMMAQIIAAIMLAGLGLGVVLALLIGYGGRISLPGIGGGNIIKSSDLNISFERPGSSWQDNSALREKMEVSLVALQRDDPPAWLVFDARDYKDHDPTAKELDDEARGKLGAYFGSTLETEPVRGKLQAAPDRIAGQPAHVLVFQGEVDGEHVAGECYSFHYQGIGYWFYAWKRGTVEQRDDAEFPSVRKRIAVLGERSKWNELEQRRQTFAGTKIAGLQLTDGTGRWQSQDEPDTYDPAADVVLFAADPKNPKLRTKGCFLLVMTIPATQDAVGAAKAYILEKHKRDSYDMTQIEPAGGEGANVKEAFADGKGQLLRWRIQNTPTRVLFALVGVVQREKDTVILYADCDWNNRNTWEGQLHGIMKTVKLE